MVAERLPIQRLELVGIDIPVLLFTLTASLVCGLVFGVVPALTASGTNLTDSLKEGGRSGSAARGNRMRGAFVVAEVALALVLLVGAGLLVRSFMRLLEQNPGFDPSRTVTMRLSLPPTRYGAEGQRAQFLNRFFQQVDALPGVQASGAISFLPLTGLGAATSMAIVGKPVPPRGQEPVTDVRVITHDYLRTMGVPLLKGRLFNEQDAADAKGRVVINETMALKQWPGEDPIGKRVPDRLGRPGRRSNRCRRRRQTLRSRCREPSDDVLAIRTLAVRDDDDHGADRRRRRPGRVLDCRARASARPGAGGRQHQSNGRRHLQLRRRTSVDDAAADDLRGDGASCLPPWVSMASLRMA